MRSAAATLATLLLALAAILVVVVEADKKLTPVQQELLVESFLKDDVVAPPPELNHTEIASSKNVSVTRWLEIRSAMIPDVDRADAPSDADSDLGPPPALTVRKEVREMTCEDWEAYVNAVKKLYRTEHWAKYTRVHESERQLIWDLSHSDARQRLFTFLPWHRLWLRGVERELQKIDPKAAIPYWNWALDSTDPLASAVLSDHYFGGNGSAAHDSCVIDGAFRTINHRQNSNGTTDTTRCIKRFLPDTPGGFLNLVHLKDVLVGCEDFDSFNLCVENAPGFYGFMHMFLGGDEAQNTNDPLFLSMYAFIDMLWWKWQRMHGAMANPATTFRGNKEEILLPFEDHIEDVFSVEEMGYTYASPLDQGFQASTAPTCYTEKKNGTIDLVLLGHQIFDKLPNNITELVRIPRKTPLLNVEVWKQWVQLKLRNNQVPTAVELEGDLKMWAHLASWPSFNMSDWKSQEDYGLGIPLSMIIPEFFLQSQITGGEVSRSYCDGLNITNAEDPKCVMKRPKTKWYLNTFHNCVEEDLLKVRSKMQETTAASEAEVREAVKNFSYLSHEENQEQIDDAVLREAEAILTQILFDAVNPVVSYENNRFLVSVDDSDTVVEVEVVERDGAEDDDDVEEEEPFLLFVPKDRMEALQDRAEPIDQGEKLFNSASDFEVALMEDTESGAIASKKTEEALAKVNKIFNRAYLVQATGRSGIRLPNNIQNFMEAVAQSPLGRLALRG